MASLWSYSLPDLERSHQSYRWPWKGGEKVTSATWRRLRAKPRARSHTGSPRVDRSDAFSLGLAIRLHGG